jgi:hypothetical protein
MMGSLAPSQQNWRYKTPIESEFRIRKMILNYAFWLKLIFFNEKRVLRDGFRPLCINALRTPHPFFLAQLSCATKIKPTSVIL